MAQVRWTRQAADDFAAIVEFIAQDSEHYASLFAMRVIEAIERLETFPMSGRMVPECGDSAIREIIHRNCRIIYRVRGDSAQLLAVVHGASRLDESKLR